MERNNYIYKWREGKFLKTLWTNWAEMTKVGLTGQPDFNLPRCLQWTFIAMFHVVRQILTFGCGMPICLWGINHWIDLAQDLVIIMSGTNDMGKGTPSDVIVEDWREETIFIKMLWVYPSVWKNFSPSIFVDRISPESLRTFASCMRFAIYKAVPMVHQGLVICWSLTFTSGRRTNASAGTACSTQIRLSTGAAFSSNDIFHCFTGV